MKYLNAVVRGGTLVVLSGVFVACADGNPTAPARRLEPTLLNTAHAIAKGHIVTRTTMLSADIAETRRITSHGGFIYIQSAGVYVLFPAGAVTSDVDVTVTAHAGNKVIYSFEPHGTTFLQPIWVVQELRHTELNTPRSAKVRPEVWAGYLEYGLQDVASDGTGAFSEVFKGAYHGKGNDAVAYFTTTHFSGYAMASGRRESAGAGHH